MPHFRSSVLLLHLSRNLFFIILGFTLTGCYMVDFMQRSHQDDSSEGNSAEVLGDDLGARAGARDAGALAAVYAVKPVNLPASVRPDPDLLARRLLRQFRAEGTTLARAIGDVENYRGLLGGASLDFATAPANGVSMSLRFDASSLVTSRDCMPLIASGMISGWARI